LGGITPTGCTTSSPVDVFSRWMRPSLESTYNDAGPLTNGAVAGAPRPAAGGAARIAGIAVSPPEQAVEEPAACGSLETYSRCFCQNTLPRSASIAYTISALVPTNASSLNPRYEIRRPKMTGGSSARAGFAGTSSFNFQRS